MSALGKDRELLKQVLREKMDEAHAMGRTGLANVFYGQIIRTDAGRYDRQLREKINSLRMEQVPIVGKGF